MDNTKVVDVGVEACKDGKFEVKAVGATKLANGRKIGKKELRRHFFKSQQLRAYYSEDGDPLACEKELKEPLRRWLLKVRQQLEKTEWAGAVVQSPRFLKSQSKAARRVAAIRGDADIGLSFVDNARLLLIGSEQQVKAICSAARAEAIAARKAGLSHKDLFHFVASVPVLVLAALRHALTSKTSKGDIDRAKAKMREMIKASGVKLDEAFDIDLNWAAFPGRGGWPCVRRLRTGELVGLKDLAKLDGGQPYIVIGGFFDVADYEGPSGSFRRDRYELNLPGGKRDPGESGLDCSLRETFEETLLRLHTNYDHEYPEGPGIDVRGVKINYDYGPYHIVASVPAPTAVVTPSASPTPVDAD